MHKKSSSQAAGFTVTEILFVMTILSIVMVGVFGAFTQAQMALFISTQKANINRDMRNFTGELTEIARNANHFFIYDAIATSDRNEAKDRKVQGQTGDLLVLIFQEPYPNLDDPQYITRLVAYYRDATATTRGPIRKWEVQYATTDYKLASDNAVETLLPSVANFQSAKKVVELSEGLANGQLFLNYEDRSIMVKGQILHGNEFKRLTDTYNFTITPRG